MRFSERMGYKKARDTFQAERIENDSLNVIWNAVYDYLITSSYFERTMIAIWREYFKQPIDDIPYEKTLLNDKCLVPMMDVIKKYFYKAEWYDIYDFLEFLGDLSFRQYNADEFITKCNYLFKKELIGYRFIDRMISPITDELEVKEIDKALSAPIDAVKIHLSTALSHLSNKTNPDYRNSIKESICAVETICRLITKESTLDNALKNIQNQIEINGQLKQSLEKMYHYTNSKEGIRHSLMVDTEPGQEEAIFMLVFSSAAVNYIYSKAIKEGVEF